MLTQKPRYLEWESYCGYDPSLTTTQTGLRHHPGPCTHISQNLLPHLQTHRPQDSSHLHQSPVSPRVHAPPAKTAPLQLKTPCTASAGHLGESQGVCSSCQACSFSHRPPTTRTSAPGPLGLAVDGNPIHLVERSSGGQKCHNNPRLTSNNTPRLVQGAITIITCVEPPASPSSEQCSTTCWIPDVCSECSQRGLPSCAPSPELKPVSQDTVLQAPAL